MLRFLAFKKQSARLCRLDEGLLLEEKSDVIFKIDFKKFKFFSGWKLLIIIKQNSIFTESKYYYVLWLD